MDRTFAISRRELAAYFSTPLAYVFIVIFLALAGSVTFYFGTDRNQADLAPFFNFHPWLYLFLIPALSMRLWAEERKSGSIELLMTLPVTTLIPCSQVSCRVDLHIALALTFRSGSRSTGSAVLTMADRGEPSAAG
jgi:ABC-2 type transport system permease protein